jgi:hypothetical protein
MSSTRLEKKPSSSRRIILAVVVLGVAAAIIGGAYFIYAFLIEGGSGEASEEISAPTIDPQTLAAIASTQQAAAATSAAANATAEPTTNADLPPAPTEEIRRIAGAVSSDRRITRATHQCRRRN